jgi:hypothetical protein
MGKGRTAVANSGPKVAYSSAWPCTVSVALVQCWLASSDTALTYQIWLASAGTALTARTWADFHNGGGAGAACRHALPQYCMVACSADQVPCQLSLLAGC